MLRTHVVSRTLAAALAAGTLASCSRSESTTGCFLSSFLKNDHPIQSVDVEAGAVFDTEGRKISSTVVENPWMSGGFVTVIGRNLYVPGTLVDGRTKEALAYFDFSAWIGVSKTEPDVFAIGQGSHVELWDGEKKIRSFESPSGVLGAKVGSDRVVHVWTKNEVFRSEAGKFKRVAKSVWPLKTVAPNDRGVALFDGRTLRLAVNGRVREVQAPDGLRVTALDGFGENWFVGTLSGDTYRLSAEGRWKRIHHRYAVPSEVVAVKNFVFTVDWTSSIVILTDNGSSIPIFGPHPTVLGASQLQATGDGRRAIVRFGNSDPEAAVRLDYMARCVTEEAEEQSRIRAKDYAKPPSTFHDYTLKLEDSK